MGFNEEDYARRKRVAKSTLRVKVKSLADEARVIRAEMRKCRKSRKTTHVVGHLYSHLQHVVKPQARIGLLAYAAVRGVPYSAVEQKAKQAPDMAAVRRCAERHLIVIGYTHPFVNEMLQPWFDAAAGHLTKQRVARETAA